MCVILTISTLHIGIKSAFKGQYVNLFKFEYNKLMSAWSETYKFHDHNVCLDYGQSVDILEISRLIIELSIKLKCVQ